MPSQDEIDLLPDEPFAVRWMREAKAARMVAEQELARKMAQLAAGKGAGPPQEDGKEPFNETSYIIQRILERKLIDKRSDPSFCLSVQKQIKEKGGVSWKQAAAIRRVAEKFRVFAPEQNDN
jgi:hypothetical protein